MQQGIAVNLETPEPSAEASQNATSKARKHSSNISETSKESDTKESQNAEGSEDDSSDPSLQSEDQTDKNSKRKGNNHQKHKQHIIGQGIHKEVWNEKTGEYESSFKAYLRQQNEKEENQSVFEFETYGENKELVMTRNNSKVLMTLCLCALVGGIVAGLIIRFLMRKFFPTDYPEEKGPIIRKSLPGKDFNSSKVTYDTENSNGIRSTRTDLELV